MAFGRIIHLYVGKFAVGNLTSQNSKDFSQFDIEFEVTRSIEWYDNEATITIYNPSPEAINFIMSEGNSVLLQAGYEDETVGNIFVGQIGMAVPRRVGSDVELVITCVSARGTFYQLARLNCAIQFDSSATVKKCLQELCDYAGTALRAGNQKELSQPIGTEFCISGTFKQAVCSFRDNILIPKFGLHLYFDNNEMIVVNSDEKSIEVEEMTLDFKSGLLQAEEIRDESLNKVNFADDPSYYLFSQSEADEPSQQKKPSKEIDRTRKIHFTALISPKYAPNVFVRMDSSKGDSYDSVGSMAIKGDFIITEPVKGFINAAGIESPGLSSAPAIAVYLAEMVGKDIELKADPLLSLLQFSAERLPDPVPADTYCCVAAVYRDFRIQIVVMIFRIRIHTIPPSMRYRRTEYLYLSPG